MTVAAQTLTQSTLGRSRLIERRAVVGVELPTKATVLAEPRRFEELRRDAPDLGRTGVHPKAIVAVIGVYAALMLVFWIAFATAQTALTLGIITILATMYFGLPGGGALLSDSLPRGVRGRDFSEFLDGRALIATGWISGKEAFAQMIALPVCMTIGAVVIGLIWRITSA